MYDRLGALEGIEKEEIERLQDSEVAVIGLGATGSVMAESLARYGVNLKIYDRDYLEINDCYSSTIYTPEDCEDSLPKAEVCRRELTKFTNVDSRVESLNPGNISELEQVDLVLDGTDNIKTRRLISEYSQRQGKPWIYTAALADTGYSMLIDQKCFNCMMGEIDSEELGTCLNEGIVRDVAAMAAHKSSHLALRFLTGKDVEEKLHRFPDGKSFPVSDNGCEVCDQEEYKRLNSTERITSVCGEDKYQIEISSKEEHFRRLKLHGEVIAENEFILRVKIEGKEFALYRSGGALVEARDPGHAEARFSEILGI